MVQASPDGPRVKALDRRQALDPSPSLQAVDGRRPQFGRPPTDALDRGQSVAQLRRRVARQELRDRGPVQVRARSQVAR
jgi:hypothetical protein